MNLQNNNDSKIEELILSNLKLVSYVLRNKYSQYFFAISPDDLYQAGCEGLIRAAYRYREDKNTSFSTYAYVLIQSAVLDELRNNHLIPINHNYYTDLKDYFEEAQQTKISLSEFCEKYHKNESILQKVLNAAKIPLSLDAPNYHSEKEKQLLCEKMTDYNTPELIYSKKELKETFDTIFDYTLTNREKSILKHYFGIDTKQKTQAEIAKLYHLSTNRISQIIDKALIKIRYTNQNLENYIEDYTKD